MSFLVPVLVATLAAGSPLGQFVTKDALPSVPAGFQFEAEAPADHQMSLHIRLQEQNMDKLAQRTLEISDPTHADYGKHMSKAEVDALTAPTKENVEAVTQWLASHGIDAGDVQSGYLFTTVSVNQAKKLLNADYKLYKEAATGRSTVRTTKYSVPRGVADAIAMIQPTTLFSDFGMGKEPAKMSAARPNAASGSVSAADAGAASICETEGTSAACIRENYNIKPIKHYAPGSGNTQMGIAGFLEEVPDLNDLSLYLKKFTPEIPSNTSVDIRSVNGGLTTSSGNGEANLDTQITVPLTYPIENVYDSVGGRPPIIPIDNSTENTNEPYLDWLKYVIGQEKPAQTYSISYGEDERSIPPDYINAVCSQFMKLGARGVSVLVSAGDNGVGRSNVCEDGTKIFKKFLPEFPASCPWITAVGGTVNYGENEEAEHDGGGGFSNIFTQPHYQRDVVHTYVRRLKGEFKGLFNTSGRAYPDVSASYNDFPIFYHGAQYRSGGTSASSPTVASIIALLNDYLASKGKAPLGFLNPWLYRRGNRGFRDIAKGHINGCKTVEAFPAIEGWDAATGYGVPNFEKLVGLV